MNNQPVRKIRKDFPLGNRKAIFLKISGDIIFIALLFALLLIIVLSLMENP